MEKITVLYYDAFRTLELKHWFSLLLNFKKINVTVTEMSAFKIEISNKQNKKTIMLILDYVIFEYFE